MHPGEVMNEIDNHEIKERDVTAEQKHRDDDNDRGIGQLLVTADPLVLRFPGPRRFLQLGADFAEKVSRFRDHQEESYNRYRVTKLQGVELKNDVTM